jgi:hypothetical protein
MTFGIVDRFRQVSGQTTRCSDSDRAVRH